MLDASLARARVSLVHRATLRSRRGRQGTKTASDGTSSTGHTALSACGLDLRTVEAEKMVGGSGFQDELRKTQMMNTRRTDCRYLSIDNCFETRCTQTVDIYCS